MQNKEWWFYFYLHDSYFIFSYCILHNPFYSVVFTQIKSEKSSLHLKYEEEKDELTKEHGTDLKSLRKEFDGK